VIYVKQMPVIAMARTVYKQFPWFCTCHRLLHLSFTSGLKPIPVSQILPLPRSFSPFSRTAFTDYCLDRFFWATRFFVFIFPLFSASGPWAIKLTISSAFARTLIYRIVSYRIVSHRLLLTLFATHKGIHGLPNELQNSTLATSILQICRRV